MVIIMKEKLYIICYMKREIAAYPSLVLMMKWSSIDLANAKWFRAKWRQCWAILDRFGNREEKITEKHHFDFIEVMRNCEKIACAKGNLLIRNGCSQKYIEFFVKSSFYSGITIIILKTTWKIQWHVFEY